MKPANTCKDCARDLERFDPACCNCGRRYLAAIKARPMNREDKVAWLRKVLADWMKYGHSEAQLRAPVDKPAEKLGKRRG